jgi:hypothetical protein
VRLFSAKTPAQEPLAPVPDFVFNPSRMGRPDDAAGGLRSPLQAKHVRKKNERHELLLRDAAGLNLELGIYATARILGSSDTDTCLADLRAEARGSTELEAAELLNHIKLARYGSELVVSTPFTTRMATMAKCHLEIITPVSCPIDVRGCLSQVEIVNVSGPINISLAYGSISLFDTTGLTNAHTGPGGRIVFSGSQGRVALRSGGEINLKLPCQVFEGYLEATTRDEPIRILLASAFQSSLQARATDVICRLQAESEINKRQENEKTIICIGTRPPNIRLEALDSSIVIDEIGS